MRFLLAFFLVFLYLFSISHLFAKEPEFLLESNRARGMGNAFVAVANDEYVLYQNPAGLVSMPHNIYSIVGIGGTSSKGWIEELGGTLEVTKVKPPKEVDSDKLEVLAGKKIYVEAGTSPIGLVGLPCGNSCSWGLSLSASTIFDILVHNPIFPYFELRAFAQGALLGGFAISFWDYAFDVGMNFKTVRRDGTQREFHAFDSEIVELVEKRNRTPLEETWETATSASADVGFMLHFENYPIEQRLGGVMRNIGGMDFGKAGSIPMQIDLGYAAEAEWFGLDFLFALDYHDLANEQHETFSFERNLKFGLEVGILKLFNGHHLLSFRLGQNGAYSTQGATLNLYGIKFDLAYWSQELGEVAGEKEDPRLSLQVSFIL